MTLEKVKTSQVELSVVAFSISTHKDKYTSVGSNLQRIIRTQVGGAEHV